MLRLLLIIADLYVICTTNVDSTRTIAAVGIVLLALSLYFDGKYGD